MVSLDFSMYSMSAAVTIFVLPFQFEVVLFLFSSPTAITRTSRTMLNKSGKSGHPCLVLYLRSNAFSYSPLSAMLV